jgi:hypothetical protein
MNRFLKKHQEIQSLEEANDTSGLYDLIMMNFYKMTNGSISSGDEKKIMLLTAAMGILNSSRDSRAMNAARKLYQKAMN